jgi:CO/xanthine dehydrogenase Mo-binding subunit
VRLSGTGNAGAYIYPPMPATTNAVKNIIDVYRTPAMEVNSKVVFTNTTPLAAYRGAGRPEGNYYMERLIDTAAREMGIDRIELRRPQPHRAQPDALQGAVGHELRFGRVHHGARQGAGRRRLERLRQAQGRERRAQQAARAAASALISKSPAAEPRSMAASASRTTAPSPC